MQGGIACKNLIRPKGEFIYFLISQSLCYPTAFFLGEDNSIECTIHYMILGNEDKIESVFRNGCVLRTCLD